MKEVLYYNNLYLIYKDLLNDLYKDIFNLYYGENLTYQEIADLKNISKARVGVIIKNTQKKLDNYELVLGVYKKNNKLEKLLDIDDINIIKNKIEGIIKGD